MRFTFKSYVICFYLATLSFLSESDSEPDRKMWSIIISHMMMAAYEGSSTKTKPSIFLSTVSGSPHIISEQLLDPTICPGRLLLIYDSRAMDYLIMKADDIPASNDQPTWKKNDALLWSHVVHY